MAEHDHSSNSSSSINYQDSDDDFDVPQLFNIGIVAGDVKQTVNTKSAHEIKLKNLFTGTCSTVEGDPNVRITSRERFHENDNVERFLENELNHMVNKTLCLKVTPPNPGECIFDLKFRKKLYDFNELIFNSLPEVKTDFDKYLQTKSFDDLKILLSENMLLQHFENVTSKKYFVQLLFRLISSFEELYLATKCKEILIRILQTNSDLCAFITIEHLWEAMIHLGARFDVAIFSKIIKLPDVCFDTWYTQKINVLNEISKDGCCGLSLLYFLNSILEIVSFKFSLNNIYSFTELSSYVITLVYISLDVNVLRSPSITKLRLCLDDVLSAFEDAQWDVEVNDLARSLISLTSHYHNCRSIAQLFSHSARGFQLRRMISFLMLHRVCNCALPLKDLEDVTPDDVLKLVIEQPLSSYEDAFLLENVIWFLDKAVCTKKSRKYKHTLMGLMDQLQNIEKKLNNTFDLEDFKVINLIGKLYSKWKDCINTVPWRQKTLFSYYTIKNDQSNFDAESVESFNDNSNSSENVNESLF